MPRMSDGKVALKKIIQICSNFDTLSMHVILFSISARILMNSSFFVRLFSARGSFWAGNKLEIFRGFQQGIILSSCIIPGDQLKFNCRTRIQESKYCSTRNSFLNSLFPLIITTSGANGSITVGKLYNQVCF